MSRRPRVFAPAPWPEPGALVVGEEEASHLARVLRVRPGDEVEVFDGEGRLVLATVGEVKRSKVRLSLGEALEPPPELPFLLTCAVAPPKGKRCQRLVEALTELGVSGWIPLLTRRGEVHPPHPSSALRWSREAAKQCGRARLLELAEPTELAELPPAELTLVGDTEGATPLRAVLARRAPVDTLLVIGPVGGFAARERELLRERGAQPVGLGHTVLRIETAAQALVGALLAAWA